MRREWGKAWKVAAGNLADKEQPWATINCLTGDLGGSKDYKWSQYLWLVMGSFDHTTHSSFTEPHSRTSIQLCSAFHCLPRMSNSLLPFILLFIHDVIIHHGHIPPGCFRAVILSVHWSSIPCNNDMETSCLKLPARRPQHETFQNWWFRSPAPTSWGVGCSKESFISCKICYNFWRESMGWNQQTGNPQRSLWLAHRAGACHDGLQWGHLGSSEYHGLLVQGQLIATQRSFFGGDPKICGSQGNPKIIATWMFIHDSLE